MTRIALTFTVTLILAAGAHAQSFYSGNYWLDQMYNDTYIDVQNKILWGDEDAEAIRLGAQGFATGVPRSSSPGPTYSQAQIDTMAQDLYESAAREYSLDPNSRTGAYVIAILLSYSVANDDKKDLSQAEANELVTLVQRKGGDGRELEHAQAAVRSGLSWALATRHGYGAGVTAARRESAVLFQQLIGPLLN